MGNLVLFDSVTICYPGSKPLLKGVNFLLAPGSFYFLTGASGAGKSSLLKLIYMGLRPAAGSVTLFGRNTKSLNRDEAAEMRRKMGIVFQDFRLIDHLNLFDNVALPMRIAGAKETDVRRYVTELLRWVGLAEVMEAFPSQLSGGEQQRAAIARAVIGKPNILLADEPTGNIDSQMGTKLMYLFEELNRMGTTVIIATHNDSWLQKLPHHQLRIEAGKVKLIEHSQYNVL